MMVGGDGEVLWPRAPSYVLGMRDKAVHTADGVLCACVLGVRVQVGPLAGGDQLSATAHAQDRDSVSFSKGDERTLDEVSFFRNVVLEFRQGARTDAGPQIVAAAQNQQVWANTGVQFDGSRLVVGYSVGVGAEVLKDVEPALVEVVASFLAAREKHNALSDEHHGWECHRSGSTRLLRQSSRKLVAMRSVRMVSSPTPIAAGMPSSAQRTAR